MTWAASGACLSLLLCAVPQTPFGLAFADSKRGSGSLLPLRYCPSGAVLGRLQGSVSGLLGAWSPCGIAPWPLQEGSPGRAGGFEAALRLASHPDQVALDALQLSLGGAVKIKHPCAWPTARGVPAFPEGPPVGSLQAAGGVGRPRPLPLAVPGAPGSLPTPGFLQRAVPRGRGPALGKRPSTCWRVGADLALQLGAVLPSSLSSLRQGGVAGRCPNPGDRPPGAGAEQGLHLLPQPESWAPSVSPSGPLDFARFMVAPLPLPMSIKGPWSGARVPGEGRPPPSRPEVGAG